MPGNAVITAEAQRSSRLTPMGDFIEGLHKRGIAGDSLESGNAEAMYQPAILAGFQSFLGTPCLAVKFVLGGKASPLSSHISETLDVQQWCQVRLNCEL